MLLGGGLSGDIFLKPLKTPAPNDRGLVPPRADLSSSSYGVTGPGRRRKLAPLRSRSPLSSYKHVQAILLEKLASTASAAHFPGSPQLPGASKEVFSSSLRLAGCPAFFLPFTLLVYVAQSHGELSAGPDVLAERPGGQQPL